MTYNDSAVSALEHHAALLAIELDPQDFDPTGIPPAPLNVATAEALAAHLAKDLNCIFDGIEQLGLVVPGALYDQTEILQPGFPLIEALADLYRRSLQGGFRPAVMALGSDSGYLPVAAIDPQRRPGSGPLLLLPVCLIGPREPLQRIARIMEDGLLQNGVASPATRDMLQQVFAIRALNISFATLGDLCAMLHNQLEGNGLLPLWGLLEHAWFARPEVCAVTLESGNRFLVAEDHAHTVFYTFDDWAQFGPGRDVPKAELGNGYTAWARLQRQYTMACAAYGLEVRAVLANPRLEATLSNQELDGATLIAALREIPCLSGEFLVESVFQNALEATERHLLITHHAVPELGTLAYTVMSHDADGHLLHLEHHYPLQPQGVTAIIDRLLERCHQQGAQRQVLHPGRLLHSEEGRALRFATDADLPQMRQAAVHAANDEAV